MKISKIENNSKTMLLFCILSLLFLPFKIYAKSTDEATELINSSKTVSLELTYKYDDIVINDINVKIYKIASVSNDFQYSLSDSFKSYNVKINGIKSKDELRSLSETLESYVYADLIQETSNGIIRENKVEFKDLETGLYLVITDKIDKKDCNLIYETFLISLPTLGEDNNWIYNVSSEPKPVLYEPKYEIVLYSVIKEWKDTGSQLRPDHVNIEIYKNGIKYEDVILSSKNNWMYSWNVLDDGSIFTVAEREIPGEYTVSIKKNDKKFIVVNTKNEDNPGTLDNIYLYLVLFASSFIGMTLLLLVLKSSKDYSRRL